MPEQHPREISLPLRGHEQPSFEAVEVVVSERLIRRLVETFYGRVVRDESLGPVFSESIVDWPAHISKMCDFWSAVTLHTGRYAGRPLEAHRALDSLQPDQFQSWIQLWESVVREVVPNPLHDQFIVPAQRMARHMRHRLFA